MILKRYYLSLGSNVGDRLGFILKALDKLKTIGTITKISTVYESVPWGVPNQERFLNMAIEFYTSLKEFDLLFAIKAIEKELGRIKTQKWGPREIDIDILFYESNIVKTMYLVIPHPYILERDFFYYPLLELNENLYHPLERKFLKDIHKRPQNNLVDFCCIYL